MSSLPTANATPREVAKSYWAAEIQRDVDLVLAHYHPDAIFIPNGRRLVGHAEIRTFYAESCRNYPVLEVEIVSNIGGDRISAIEWSAAVTDHSGHRVPFVGVNLVTVDAGRFREVRAFFDESKLP